MSEFSQPIVAAMEQPQESPKPTPSAAHSIFFGRFGMRAGWSIAIFLIVWLVLTVPSSFAGLALSGQIKSVLAARATNGHYRAQLLPSLTIGSNGLLFFGLLFVCWFFARAERRPFRAYGIGRNRWRDVFPGALWGLFIMSAVVGLLTAMHLLVFDGRALHGAAIVTWGLRWLIAFVFVGFAEEYQFRGYMLYTLMRGVWGLAEKISAANTQNVAFWISGVLMSLLFAAAHLGNGGENFFGIVQVFLAGITFVYALWRTGSLWWAIGFHATWDWAQSFLFGVADSGQVSVGRLFVTHAQGNPLLSGGSAGPEGSIFASLALLITIGVLNFVARDPLAGPEQRSQELQDALAPAPFAGFGTTR